MAGLEPVCYGGTTILEHDMHTQMLDVRTVPNIDRLTHVAELMLTIHPMPCDCTLNYLSL
jgi:hypothetical protein